MTFLECMMGYFGELFTVRIQIPWTNQPHIVLSTAVVQDFDYALLLLIHQISFLLIFTSLDCWNMLWESNFLKADEEAYMSDYVRDQVFLSRGIDTLTKWCTVLRLVTFVVHELLKIY